MGLLDFLGPAVNAATQVTSAYEGGQDAAAKARQQAVVQQLTLLRQQHDQALNDALARAQLGDIQSQQGLRTLQGQHLQYEMDHPKPVKPNYAPPVIGPNGEVQLINLDDPTHPIKVPGVQGKVEHEPQGPVAHYAIQNVTGADGQVHLARVNSLTGEVTELPNLGKQPAIGGGGGMGSLSPNAVQAMYEQAAQADSVMRKFEEKYRTDPGSIGTLSQGLGAGAYQHPKGLLSGLSGAASNAMLGMTNPEYQQYIAAQKRFGNIMGNLMSRRYSEYQGALDTQLAGLSSGDVEPTINLKQSYRSELLKNRPGAAPAVRAPSQSHSSEAGLSDADLWEQKREEGMSPAQATAYVRERHN